MRKQIVWAALIAVIGIFLAGCENTYVTSAKVYIQQQQYDKAIEMCETAIAQSPSNPDAYFVLGKAHSLKNNYKEMNEAFKKSMAISPIHSEDIEYLRGKAYIELVNSAAQLANNQKYDEAIVKYQLAKDIIPSRPEAYDFLAITYQNSGNDSLAIVTYDELLSVMPDSVRFAYKAGAVLYKMKKWEPATKQFGLVVEKSVEGSPLYLAALADMANAYAMMKQEDKALEIYQKALDKDPGNTDIIYNMGRMFLLQEQHEKAIEAFKKVLEKNPSDLETNLQVGNSYLMINNKLIEDYNQLLEANKLTEKEVKTRKDAMNDNFKLALPYFEKSIEINPESSIAWYYAGTVYVRLGETKKAEEAYAKSEELKAQGK